MDDGIVLVENNETGMFALYIDGERVVTGNAANEQDILDALGCTYVLRYTSDDELYEDILEFEDLTMEPSLY